MMDWAVHAGNCSSSANCINYLTGYRHVSTLINVGKPVVYVLSPSNPANKNCKGYGILDNC